MHTLNASFPPPGTDLGHLDVTVSAEANDRYWRGAGIEHSARDAGVLYPPMAVNFAILLVQQTVPEGLLHTWGRLRCHATGKAGESVQVTGQVLDRFERRHRDYFTVVSEVHAEDGALLWSTEIDLAAPRRRPGAGDTGGPVRPRYRLPGETEAHRRTLTFTDDLLRTYSRAGNFHSDDAAAAAMGLPGMVAMGMQTLGPACSLLLDGGGEELLGVAELEARFFGLVFEGDTVEAAVTRSKDAATFELQNLTKGVATAAGRMRVIDRRA